MLPPTVPFPNLFPAWVTSDRGYWAIFAERQRTSRSVIIQTGKNSAVVMPGEEVYDLYIDSFIRSRLKRYRWRILPTTWRALPNYSGIAEYTILGG